ncbi:MAG: DUF4058 family protein [Cyanobacteria bacterium P01_C01_bin.118]
MIMPFPGMDPYLEHPEIWPGVHLLLITTLAESLTPQLRPKYSVLVAVRLYETPPEQKANTALVSPSSQPMLVEVPMPVTVRQGYLEVREVATKEVIAAIELLSPINKRPGQGRRTYETKREHVLASSTHLVEIDLLRAHEPMPILGQGWHSDYRILVSRSELRPQAELYGFNLRDKIPTFSLPLSQDDQAPTVDLQSVLNQIYERSGYDLKLDYQEDPVPSFNDEENRWMHNLLTDKGLRSSA